MDDDCVVQIDEQRYQLLAAQARQVHALQLGRGIDVPVPKARVLFELAVADGVAVGTQVLIVQLEDAQA